MSRSLQVLIGAAAVGLLAAAFLARSGAGGKTRSTDGRRSAGNGAPVAEASPAAPSSPVDRAGPEPPEPPASPLTRELARLRSALESVRLGATTEDQLRMGIRSTIRARTSKFDQILAAHPEAASELLEIVVAEEDPTVRLSLARLLRPAAEKLRTRLLELSGAGNPELLRRVGLAALGSASDEGEMAALEAGTASGAPKGVRLTALDSLAADPEAYRSWGGTERAASRARVVLETDVDPAVRSAGVRAWLKLVSSSDERTRYLEDRIRAETDPGVRRTLKQGLPRVGSGKTRK